MRTFAALILVLFVPGLAIAGDAKKKSPYFDHIEKKTLVAWSKDGKSYAYRRETVQWHESSIGGGKLPEGMASERSVIDVRVVRCASPYEKDLKYWKITTPEDQSKASRGKNWKRAERWLEKSGYLFVAGKKAKPIENDLTEAPEETSGLGFPFPRRLRPEWMKTLYLRVGTADFDYESELKIFDPKSHLLVGLAGYVKGDPTLWQKYDIYLHHDGALPSLDDGTTCTVEYGPKALCFVVSCTGYGAYTSSKVTHQSFRVNDLKKHLPAADWSSHSEQ